MSARERKRGEERLLRAAARRNEEGERKKRTEPAQPKNQPKRTEPLLVPGLRHPAVEPVDDVQSAVGSQQKHIVSREVVDVAGALEQHELREDGDGLEQDREGPGRLHRAAPVRGQREREQRGGSDEERDAEGVVGRVVRLSDALHAAHEVEDRRGGGEEDELHQGVVEGDVAVGWGAGVESGR